MTGGERASADADQFNRAVRAKVDQRVTTRGGRDREIADGLHAGYCLTSAPTEQISEIV